MGGAVLVEVFSSQTSDGGRESKLANAKKEGDEVCCNHFGGWMICC